VPWKRWRTALGLFVTTDLTLLRKVAYCSLAIALNSRTMVLALSNSPLFASESFSTALSATLIGLPYATSPLKRALLLPLSSSKLSHVPPASLFKTLAQPLAQVSPVSLFLQGDAR
jgi:hypothetical protein